MTLYNLPNQFKDMSMHFLTLIKVVSRNKNHGGHKILKVTKNSDFTCLGCGNDIHQKSINELMFKSVFLS